MFESYCSISLLYSFEDLRTMHGQVYPTYQEAAKTPGSFEDESEEVRTMREAVAAYSGQPSHLERNSCHGGWVGGSDQRLAAAQDSSARWL